jgi:hypothetical protein
MRFCRFYMWCIAAASGGVSQGAVVRLESLRDPVTHLLESAKPAGSLAHRGTTGVHHAAPVAVGPGHCAQERTAPGAVARGMRSGPLGLLPGATDGTPAVMSYSVRPLPCDGWQCNHVTCRVRRGQGERRVPTGTTLGPHLVPGRGGGNSAWRWPRWPGVPPAVRGVVAVGRWRGCLEGESDDGGRWEGVACGVRRASRVATRSWSGPSASRLARSEACTAEGVCSQSWGVKGNGQPVRMRADSGAMTSPGSRPEGQMAGRCRAARGDQVQRNMCDERQTPSAMPCVCHGVLPGDRARTQREMSDASECANGLRAFPETGFPPWTETLFSAPLTSHLPSHQSKSHLPSHPSVS